MAILSPEHLLEQSEKLIQSPPAGRPRQVDLRRAISAAYYAVFHAVLTAAADQFIGITKRNTKLYTLVYRSVDHRWFRDLCSEATKARLPDKYQQYAPSSGLDVNIQAFALAAIDLQQKRHTADYDPSVRVRSSDALFAIKAARDALARFNKADANARECFLGLLLFRPR